MYKFSKGDRVKDKEDHVTGTVINADDRYETQVHWDVEGNLTWIETRFLIPETLTPEQKENEARRIERVQAKVNEAAVSLEAAFKAWADAAKIHAGKEPTNHQLDEGEAYPMREDELIDVSPFEKVLEKHGWSTSSLYC